jgi:hypothetical protein
MIGSRKGLRWTSGIRSKKLEAMEIASGCCLALAGNRERKQEAMALTEWAPLVDITEDARNT